MSGACRVTDALTITERDSEGVHVMSPAGELDLATAPTFCARVDAARRMGCKRLIFDLTRLEFCDSRGLRALIGAGEEVVAGGGGFVLIPPADGPVARLFALTGVHEFVPLYSDVSDGLAALTRHRQR